MSDPFDLDAARAARLEARGEPKWFVFGGQKFELPPELPAEFAYLLDDAKESMQFILADQFDDFWAHRPSTADLIDLVAWITRTAYRTNPGESSASAGSSKPGGPPSRPTSPGTTRSTSAKRASVRKPSERAVSST